MALRKAGWTKLLAAFTILFSSCSNSFRLFYLNFRSFPWMLAPNPCHILAVSSEADCLMFCRLLHCCAALVPSQQRTAVVDVHSFRRGLAPRHPPWQRPLSIFRFFPFLHVRLLLNIAVFILGLLLLLLHHFFPSMLRVWPCLLFWHVLLPTHYYSNAIAPHCNYFSLLVFWATGSACNGSHLRCFMRWIWFLWAVSYVMNDVFWIVLVRLRLHWIAFIMSPWKQLSSIFELHILLLLISYEAQVLVWCWEPIVHLLLVVVT